jgi:hypothetical protein
MMACQLALTPRPRSVFDLGKHTTVGGAVVNSDDELGSISNG